MRERTKWETDKNAVASTGYNLLQHRHNIHRRPVFEKSGTLKKRIGVDAAHRRP